MTTYRKRTLDEFFSDNEPESEDDVIINLTDEAIQESNEVRIEEIINNNNQFYKYVVGIDPGPVNNGIFSLDLLRNKIVFRKKISFRETNEKIDVGELIERVVKYIKSPEGERIFKDAYIYVERQFDNEYNQCIQHTFQAMFAGRCSIVYPQSIKSFFAQLFPYLDVIEYDKKKAQYSFNKKNSHKHATEFIRQNDLIDRRDRLEEMRHDVDDAQWLAVYGSVKNFKKSYTYQLEDPGDSELVFNASTKSVRHRPSTKPPKTQKTPKTPKTQKTPKAQKTKKPKKASNATDETPLVKLKKLKIK